MPATRRRRIVRRAVMALAVVALLFSSYFSLWVLHYWGKVAGKPLMLPPVPAARVVFAPIENHLRGDMPGAVTLWTIKHWSLHAGTLSWQECHRVNPKRTWGEP